MYEIMRVYLSTCKSMIKIMRWIIHLFLARRKKTKHQGGKHRKIQITNQPWRRHMNNIGTDATRICKHCNKLYMWKHSTSRSLKMTYCSTFCEKLSLGFTIDGLLESLTQRSQMRNNPPRLAGLLGMPSPSVL